MLQPELAFPLCHQGCHQPLEQMDPDSITHLEFHSVMLDVIGIFVMLPRLLEPIPDVAEELITVHELLVHDRYSSRTWCVLRNCWWISAVDDAK
jgi:hypothetical protein